ncbi:unnamed protein product, partial [Nesidiocoris tenuis]
ARLLVTFANVKKVVSMCLLIGRCTDKRGYRQTLYILRKSTLTMRCIVYSKQTADTFGDFLSNNVHQYWNWFCNII